MGTVYDIVIPDTIDTYEAVLGDIVTKLMPGFVSSAGTARGAKQLVFPDVYFKLFMHVSQRSPEAVPMYPSHGVHWDS